MIRKFVSNDIDRIMEIWLAGNLEAHDFVPEEYWKSNYDMVKEMLPQADLFVWEIDGKIQGFAGMQENYLAGIFVDKKYRSSGIGRSLLDYLKERYPVFTLNVYQKNMRAVQFYLREGLKITEEELDEDTGNWDYTMSWEKDEFKVGI